MNRLERAAAFWNVFSNNKSDVDSGTHYQVWHFGDSRELADQLCELVLQGKKRATSCLVWEAEFEPATAPVPNGYSIITDFDGNPKCVIKTTELRILPFSGVGEEFASDEGEGDRSLEYWTQVHWDYFSRKCREMGREASQEMEVICERFELVFSDMD